MGSFIAILKDTWLQSRRQVMFIIMAAILLIIALISISLPKVITIDGEKEFGIAFKEKPTDFFSDMWIETYSTTLIRKSPNDKKVSPFSEEGEAKRQEKLEADAKAREAAANIPRLQRSFEIWLQWTISLLLTFSMWLFIAASSSYVPNMLESGAVDVVLSKPVSRFQVYVAKYFGGLALFSLLLTAVYSLIFLGLGFRFNHYLPDIFMALPVHIFCGAMLYAVITFVGTIFRSTALSMVIGFLLYSVVDSIFAALFSVQEMGFFADLVLFGFIDVDNLITSGRYYIPSFTYIQEIATSSCLNLPKLDWVPIYVAAAWGFGCLALGFWRFKRADY